MKKNLYFLFVVFVLLVLSSCDPERYPPPLGAWESEEPRMVLHLSYTANPVTGFALSGFYYANGVSTEIVSAFRNRAAPILEIYDANMVYEGSGLSNASRLFTGTFGIIDNQLHYTLSPEFQEKTGYTTIIFNEIDEDDALDLMRYYLRLR